MEKNNKEENTLVYQMVYPKKISKERIARLKRQGIAVCPRCGSEAVRFGKAGENPICLRCGNSFDNK